MVTKESLPDRPPFCRSGSAVWHLLYPTHNEVVGGYNGFTPSVCPSVRPSRIQCPLCSAYSSGWIHFIFIHLVKQLQKEGVLCVQFFAKLQNLNFWQFFKICDFDFVLFWLGIWCESLVWVIMWCRRSSHSSFEDWIIITWVFLFPLFSFSLFK